MPQETLETGAPSDTRILSAVSYISIAAVFPFFFLLIPYLAPLLIFLFIKQDKFVRFNALQALIIVVSYTIMVILFAMSIVGLVVAIPSVIIYWLFCIWAAREAYTGKIVHVPTVTELAKSYI